MLAAMLILAAVFWGVYRLLSKNYYVKEALAASDTELAIKDLVINERTQREKTSAENLLNQQTERNELTAGLLERDRRELLMLVNPWNKLPEDYEPRLVNIGKTDAGGNEMMFDERGASALKQMVQDCLKAGWAPVPISSYRTQEYQQELFDNKIERLIAEMQTPQDQLETVAAQSVARPGTSEHQTGLAADIIDEFYTSLDYVQMWTSTQQWLMKHCTEYGFILRYPEDSTDITGITFEPWHYRYVGKTVAEEITEKGITFEEYLEQLA